MEFISVKGVDSKENLVDSVEFFEFLVSVKSPVGHVVEVRKGPAGSFQNLLYLLVLSDFGLRERGSQNSQSFEAGPGGVSVIEIGFEQVTHERVLVVDADFLVVQDNLGKPLDDVGRCLRVSLVQTHEHFADVLEENLHPSLRGLLDHVRVKLVERVAEVGFHLVLREFVFVKVNGKLHQAPHDQFILVGEVALVLIPHSDEEV